MEIVGDHDDLQLTDSTAELAAAQNDRRQRAHHRYGDETGIWPGLDERLAADAERLSHHMVGGSLVLFVGAGVSRGAGLPGWEALLETLAMDAQMDEREREALRKLHHQDRARVRKYRATVVVMSSSDFGVTPRPHRQEIGVLVEQGAKNQSRHSAECTCTRSERRSPR